MRETIVILPEEGVLTELFGRHNTGMMCSFFSHWRSEDMVPDPASAQWQVSDIVGSCALASIFTTGAFALLASVRLAAEDSADVCR